MDASVDWGDYDNDGDLDILLTGYSSSGIFQRFTETMEIILFTEQTSISLTGVSYEFCSMG